MAVRAGAGDQEQGHGVGHVRLVLHLVPLTPKSFVPFFFGSMSLRLGG
jgi:hypothetical protein